MNGYRFLGCWYLVVILSAPATFGAPSYKLSEATHKRLAEVHALMEEGAYGDALQRLDTLNTSVKRDAYEHAMALQTYGYLFSAMGERVKAVEALNVSLELKALPRTVSQDLRYLLAQLQVAEADYSSAARNLELWLNREKEPSPDAHALAGMVHAHLKQQSEAEQYLEKALSSQGEHPEDWYRQLLALHYEAGRYEAAAHLLQRMIAAFPQRKAYWVQLSGVYAKLDDDHAALAVLELGRLRGILSQENDLLDLSANLLRLGVPLKAAELLETALRDGTVKPTRAYWERLSDAWLRANEMDRAARALDRALQLSTDPELYLRRARLAVRGEDWQAVLASVSSALESDRLDHPGEAHLLAGVAHLNSGAPDAALHAFEQAEAYEETHEHARQWIDFLAPGESSESSGR